MYGREIGVLGYVCMHGIPENRELHVRPLGIDWYSLAYREHNWLWRISLNRDIFVKVHSLLLGMHVVRVVLSVFDLCPFAIEPHRFIPVE